MHLIEISPNCSLTARTCTLFYVSVLAVSLPVAIGCALAGFWPVLPFTGAELAGLWVALSLARRRGARREFIRIDERDVLVGRVAGGNTVQHRFSRAWTRVRLQPAAVATWPSRLLLASGARSVEVGAFLTEAERRSLGERLGELLGGRIVRAEPPMERDFRV